MAQEYISIFSPPAGNAGDSRVKIVFRALVKFMMVCLVGLAVWAFLVEPRRLVLRESTLTLPSWPEKFRGLRIAVFSDLHAGAPYITLDKIRQIVEKTNATNPDLILLPGDFVIHGVLGGTFMDPERVASQLKSLRARLGVFATLGNHDWWYNAARVKTALEAAGIFVLENDAARIERDADVIWIAGISDKLAGHPDITAALAKPLAKTDHDAAVIVITHNPDLFPSIPARVALTVAGHTHGGQVALPLIGRPIVPSAFGERYAAGHVVEGAKHLFVTSGIGTSILPVRFRIPPEISLLTIN
jgi:predicted MPP superfamily phosphohydrolase